MHFSRAGELSGVKSRPEQDMSIKQETGHRR